MPSPPASGMRNIRESDIIGVRNACGLRNGKDGLARRTDMCWRCTPSEKDNEHGRAIDAAIGAVAQEHLRHWRLSRRTLLRAGVGLLAWPAAQALQACATVPVTGRSQLRLISEQQEAEIGVQAFADRKSACRERV